MRERGGGSVVQGYVFLSPGERERCFHLCGGGGKGEACGERRLCAGKKEKGFPTENIECLELLPGYAERGPSVWGGKDRRRPCKQKRDGEVEVKRHSEGVNLTRSAKASPEKKTKSNATGRGGKPAPGKKKGGASTPYSFNLGREEWTIAQKTHGHRKKGATITTGAGQTGRTGQKKHLSLLHREKKQLIINLMTRTTKATSY